MYCSKCGARNDDNATTCTQCGNALRPPEFGTPATPPPPYPQAPIAQNYAQQVPPQTYGTQPPVPPGSIPNYLVQAILVTIFCCLPFGIVSIIFAAQVNSKAMVGDIQGAIASSKQAKLWAWVAFGIGIVFGGGYALFMLLMMFGAIASHHVH